MPDRQVVDVQSFLDRHPFSRYQWLVFAMCFCIVLLDGFDTAATGYIAPSLVKEWGLERAAWRPCSARRCLGWRSGRCRPVPCRTAWDGAP